MQANLSRKLRSNHLSSDFSLPSLSSPKQLNSFIPSTPSKPTTPGLKRTITSHKSAEFYQRLEVEVKGYLDLIQPAPLSPKPQETFKGRRRYKAKSVIGQVFHQNDRLKKKLKFINALGMPNMPDPLSPTARRQIVKRSSLTSLEFPSIS